MDKTRILQYALIHVQLQIRELQTQAQEIQSELDQKSGQPATSQSGPAKSGRPRKDSHSVSIASDRKQRQPLSPEARQRIADAQKKRWRKFRKTTSSPVTESQPVQE